MNNKKNIFKEIFEDLEIIMQFKNPTLKNQIMNFFHDNSVHNNGILNFSATNDNEANYLINLYSPSVLLTMANQVFCLYDKYQKITPKINDHVIFLNGLNQFFQKVLNSLFKNKDKTELLNLNFYCLAFLEYTRKELKPNKVSPLVLEYIFNNVYNEIIKKHGNEAEKLNYLYALTILDPFNLELQLKFIEKLTSSFVKEDEVDIKHFMLFNMIRSLQSNYKSPKFDKKDFLRILEILKLDFKDIDLFSTEYNTLNNKFNIGKFSDSEFIGKHNHYDRISDYLEKDIINMSLMQLLLHRSTFPIDLYDLNIQTLSKKYNKQILDLFNKNKKQYPYLISIDVNKDMLLSIFQLIDAKDYINDINILFHFNESDKFKEICDAILKNKSIDKDLLPKLTEKEYYFKYLRFIQSKHFEGPEMDMYTDSLDFEYNDEIKYIDNYMAFVRNYLNNTTEENEKIFDDTFFSLNKKNKNNENINVLLDNFIRFLVKEEYFKFKNMNDLSFKYTIEYIYVIIKHHNNPNNKEKISSRNKLLLDNINANIDHYTKNNENKKCLYSFLSFLTHC